MNTLSGLSPLSGDFNRGYTKAILDLTSVFTYIQDDLKHHHRSLNSKLALELLQCCLENRESLRESEIVQSNYDFIRYNGTAKKFEFYRGRHNTKKERTN